MLKKNELLENIDNGELERIVRLQPVDYKYLCWKDISENIVPINIDCSELTVDQAQENILSFIEANDLLRVKIMDLNNIYVMKMAEGKIPVYTIRNMKEKTAVLFKMAKKLINKSIYGRLLYDGALFVYENTIEFSGVFSHIISDGLVDLAENKKGINIVSTRINYRTLEKYMNSLTGNILTDFLEYVCLKKSLVDKYYCHNIIHFDFEVERKNRIYNKNLSLEEFWANIICLYLKDIFEIDQIPLNITSGGRMLGGQFLDLFGDFHDEFMFVVNSGDEFVKEFRYYKENPYLNAEQYKNYIFEDIDYKDYPEPVNLSVKWKTNELLQYRKKRMRLPYSERKSIISFSVLVDPSLRRVQVYVGASKKLNDKVRNCKAEFERLIDLNIKN